MPRLLLLLACAACGAPDQTPDAGPPDPVDAATECAPAVLCFPGCSVAFPGCLTGTLDLDRCECLDEAGRAQPWPEADAAPVSLYFDPPIPTVLEKGARLSLSLSVRYADDTVRTASNEAILDIEPPEALVIGDDGLATASGSGTVTMTASWGGLSTAATTTIRLREVRAVWVTRFDWSTEADVQRLVKNAADAGFNIVLFQVRGFGDAYYESTLEPWAEKLTGQLGKSPTWDPLRTALDEAHARGLQLHAYVNVFTGWAPRQGQLTPAESPVGAPRHVLLRHPEWLEHTQAGEAVNDGYHWLSPGVAAVRQWNADVIKDLVTRYDVDGVHLDRIRYPGTAFGWNALSRHAFDDAGSDDFDVFRTEAVDRQVRLIYEMLQQERPDVTLSAAVWGIHTRLPVDCESRSSQGKSDYFQDSWAWAQGGYVDALVPMIYWEENGPNPCTDWGDLYQTFADNRGSAQIWGGMNVMDGPYDKRVFDWSKLLLRLDTARAMNAPGVALYASAQLALHQVWSMLKDGPFAEPALP